MPTYEYKCRDCGDALEVVQSFSDDALTVCPTCKGSLRKVFSPVGIVLKGSGFYKNDSRSSNGKSSSSSSETKSESKTESAKTESTNGTKRDSSNGNGSSSSSDKKAVAKK